MKTSSKLLTVTLAALLGSGASLVAQGNGNPDPPRPDLSELIEQFREGRKERVQERRELAESLKELSKEERAQAMRELIEEQTAEQRALGRQIREQMKARAAEQRETAGNPNTEPAPAAADTATADDVRTLNQEFNQTRDQVLKEWRDKSDEEREAMLQQFRNKLEELRAQRREVRDRARERAEERRNRNNPGKPK